MSNKKATVTDVHREEAAALMAIWKNTAHAPQAEFGETYGIGNQSAVSQFLNGRIPLSLEAAAGFAAGLRCAIGDFSPRLAEIAARVAASQPLALELSEFSVHEPGATYNVSPGPDLFGNVPLISSVQAGEWTEIANTFRPGDADLWLPCPVKHGPMTFCLRVEGDSMKNPGSKPSYDPGDIIFVDPDVCATPGSRVVAKMDDQDKATFKQYMEEDGRRLLKALNPDWQPRYIEINGNATICGVVIGKWVEE